MWYWVTCSLLFGRTGKSLLADLSHDNVVSVSQEDYSHQTFPQSHYKAYALILEDKQQSKNKMCIYIVLF